MDVAKLARGLALNRISFGAGARARRWFAAQGMTDAIDLVATVAARDVPLPARVFAATMAAGSTAIAAAYVRSTGSGS